MCSMTQFITHCMYTVSVILTFKKIFYVIISLSVLKIYLTFYAIWNTEEFGNFGNARISK